MSKKKNTLKDLDEFLKQQAATLVSPVKLADKVMTPEVKTEPVIPTAVKEQTDVTIKNIIGDLQALAEQKGDGFRKEFYDLVIQTLESQSNLSPEDKVMINTALYLKHGNRWKEMIRSYWRNKS